MTVAAVAIALALPATLFVAVDNLERLGGGGQRSAGLSLFLRPELDDARVRGLAEELRGRNDIAAVETISREQGLAEFREYSGLGAALDQLGENPLPVVLAIDPAAAARTPQRVAALAAELESLPEADFARLDMQWIARFNAMVALLESTALLIAAVLGLAVLLIVGNTIRLEIENRRGEIEIMALVGAAPALIRRPFLYDGAWYGLLGGISAWILLNLALALLQAPVSRLASLYHTEFVLHGMGALPSVVLLAGSAVLGVLGSWMAVGRHLSGIEPD
jgi:cell division transport system permease protein